MGCCGKNVVGTEAQEKRQFDPKFKGPMEDSERHCRDCWMIPIFIAFWVGLIIVGIEGHKLGDWRRLFYGADSFGNTCGVDGNGYITGVNNSGLDLAKQNKMMWWDSTKSAGIKLCVQSCPFEDSCSLGETGSCPAVATDTSYCMSDAADSRNPYSFDEHQAKTKFGAAETGCPIRTFKSEVLMNRCIPLGDVAGGATDAVMDAINVDGVATDFVNDLEKAHVAIIIILACTMVLTLLWVFIMRWIAALLIRIAYYGLLLGSLALIGFLWYSYKLAKEDYDLTQEVNSTGGTASTKKDMDMWLALALVWSVLGGILFILLVFLRKRIELVIQLFKEAGRALTKMPLLLFYPLVTLMAVLCVMVYFGYFMLLLLSAGDRTIDDNDHVTYEISEVMQYMTLYHIFGFYWCYELCMAFQESVIAGAISTWYFTRNKSDISWPITKTLWRTIKYHLGSLLLGALIIAIVKIIQFLVWYFEKQIKKAAGGNVTVAWVLKCVKCCLWCCEKCLKFLNRNAYIEIAIYGKSFCRSAWSAFSILLRNALRVAAINTVGDFVLFLFKLIITVSAIIGAFFYFQYQDKIEGAVGDTVQGGLQWESLIILVIGLFAWLIAGMFLGVYEMAVDTIFIAFCEDAERNDGSAAKPYFMSKGLLSFMSKEERRTQKRTLKGAQHAQQKAADAQATHAAASSMQIDPEATPTSEA